MVPCCCYPISLYQSVRDCQTGFFTSSPVKAAFDKSTEDTSSEHVLKNQLIGHFSQHLSWFSGDFAIIWTGSAFNTASGRMKFVLNKTIVQSHLKNRSLA